MLTATVAELNTAVAFLRGRPYAPPTLLPCAPSEGGGGGGGPHLPQLAGPPVPCFPARSAATRSRPPDVADVPPARPPAKAAAPSADDAVSAVDRGKQREAEVMFAYSPPRGPPATADDIEALLKRLEATGSPVAVGESPATAAPDAAPPADAAAAAAKAVSTRKPKQKKIAFRLTAVRDPAPPLPLPPPLSLSVSVRVCGVASVCVHAMHRRRMLSRACLCASQWALRQWAAAAARAVCCRVRL